MHSKVPYMDSLSSDNGVNLQEAYCVKSIGSSACATRANMTKAKIPTRLQIPTYACLSFLFTRLFPSFLRAYESRKRKKPPKANRNLPGGSYWHLLETAFHNFPQKVRGYVIRLFLRLLMRGELPPIGFPIKKCFTCQSKSCLVKTIFIFHQFAC